MKWKVSEKTTPVAGSCKTVARRAWLPKTIGGVRIWFEQYEEFHVYRTEKIEAMIGTRKVEFEIGKWVKVTERVIKWQIAGTDG